MTEAAGQSPSEYSSYVTAAGGQIHSHPVKDLTKSDFDAGGCCDKSTVNILGWHRRENLCVACLLLSAPVLSETKGNNDELRHHSQAFYRP